MINEAMNLSEVPAAPEFKLFASEPDILDAAKVAELLGVATATIRREIARDNLEAVHIGRSVRITKKALLKYIGEADDE